MLFGRGRALVLCSATVMLSLTTRASAQPASTQNGAQVPVNPVALSVGADLLTSDQPAWFWTIDAGTYRGVPVEIRPRLAASTSKSGNHFWRFSGRGGRSGRIVGWPGESFPIPLAFRAGHRGSLNEQDSVRFWSIVNDMETTLGTDLFRAVTLAPGQDPTDVVVVSIEPQRNSGSAATTLSTWNSLGNIYDVRIAFRSAADATNPSVAMHELMHVLGFGHTSGWMSMMRPNEAQGLASLTIEDVAYAQVALRARGAQERLIADNLDMAIDIREGDRSCHAETVSVIPGVLVQARWAERFEPEVAMPRWCW